MATLHLIRHGQASFGSSNYDRLSETGWRQGRVTGRFLKEVITPQAAFRGDLERHRETAEALAEGYGPGFPEPRVDPNFNEFDHLEVIQRYRPAWVDPQQMKADLAREEIPRKAFHNAFVASVIRWISGQHDHEYSETWAGFSARVWAGVGAAIVGAGDAQDVVIVTSGGPVSIVMQKLLGLADRQALELNAVLANSGITRVLYSRAGRNTQRSLAAFNSTAHLELESPDLVTYR